MEKNARTDDGEEETNGGKKRKRMKEEIRNVNKNTFQVALKVEVYTHQVSSTVTQRVKLTLIDFALFLETCRLSYGSIVFITLLILLLS